MLLLLSGLYFGWKGGNKTLSHVTGLRNWGKVHGLEPPSPTAGRVGKSSALAAAATAQKRSDLLEVNKHLS